MPGRVGDKDVTIIDAFEAVGACVKGLITREQVTEIEKAICPGEGACGGMYTANTMASAAEALGMSLPGSAAPPAVDRRRDGYARRVGHGVVVELLRAASPPGRFRQSPHLSGPLMRSWRSSTPKASSGNSSASSSDSRSTVTAPSNRSCGARRASGPDVVDRRPAGREIGSGSGATTVATGVLEM